MTKISFLSLAALLAATMLSAPAISQQQQSGSPPGQQGDAPPGYGGPQSGTPSGDGPLWPVLIVTSVEVLRSERGPGGLDVVRARGLVTSGGWGQPHLIPINRGRPLDGVLDLLFQSNAPGGAAALGPFMPVEAILPVEAGHPYSGVRVRAANNVVALKALPGYAETAPPRQDCAKCLGKYFVAKGAGLPAGATAENSVREEDLPYKLRIIKPADGIPSYALNPNRLTLVLAEDGRIIDAAWD
ncbi:MAG: hypothetical protein AB7F22_11300 [Reyranella sp.]|uniref:hypothetical protein n=1 Tax=Reyranella sp. TaxID=1929291 RepID=UPI003D1183D1